MWEGEKRGIGIGFSLSKRPFSNINIFIGPPSRQTCFEYTAACIYWCLHFLDGFICYNTPRKTFIQSPSYQTQKVLTLRNLKDTSESVFFEAWTQTCCWIWVKHWTFSVAIKGFQYLSHYSVLFLVTYNCGLDQNITELCIYLTS